MKNFRAMLGGVHGRHFKVADQRDEKVYFPIWMADSDGKFWLVDIPIRSYGACNERYTWGDLYIYIILYINVKVMSIDDLLILSDSRLKATVP